MNRRALLTRIVQTFSITGLGFVAYPFLKAWIPKFKEDRSKEIDLSDLEPGDSRIVRWLGRNIYVQKRTPDTILGLAQNLQQLKDPESKQSQQPDFARGNSRSLRPDIFITYTNCTHLGCEVFADKSAFKCPCHQSDYDAAGRVLEGAAAPINLEIPHYQFISGNIVRLEILET